MINRTFTILGPNGTGKTCYLLSMYHQMLTGVQGFTLQATDKESDYELYERYQKLEKQLSSTKNFNFGTDCLNKYEFVARYYNNPFLRFTWQDYPGGYLEYKTSIDEEAYKSLESSIINSSCLIICVDGSLLTGNDFSEKVENVQEECSNILNPFFSRYMRKNKYLPLIVFLVTKYDLCARWTSKSEINEIIQEAFSSIFLSNASYSATIIPVSISWNSSSAYALSCRKEPYHVELPILVGCLFAVVDEQERLASILEKKGEEKHILPWIAGGFIGGLLGPIGILGAAGAAFASGKMASKETDQLIDLLKQYDDISERIISILDNDGVLFWG